jgi:class 3 adenylate cyclase
MSVQQQELLDEWVRYVPRLILERLIAEGRPDRPTLELTECAVLFADISGFTPLTEAYTRRGPEGVELLTRTLNDFFGRVIRIIQFHGGDIVKFAGDAITVIWRATEGDDGPVSLVLRAANCALQIHPEVAGYDADGHPLSLKLALGVGSIAVVHVGGELNRWEFAISGEPMHQVAGGGHLAEPGDTVLSPAAWALVGPFAEGVALAGGYRRLTALTRVLIPPTQATLDVPLALEEAVRAYLPAAVTRRIMAGQTDYIGELRTLTILFINLPDLRYDTPLQQAQDAMRGLQRALYFPFEGSINKLSVDDKGVTLVAALGMPPFSHEDDPSRGARAALAMLAVLADMGLRCSVGVTTGRAYCGAVGSPERREYTIMGDKVNLAARLMQGASGSVLCDADTQARARDDVEFGPGYDLRVKGKQDPVRVYEARRAIKRSALREQAGVATGLIGRQAELAQMQSLLADLVDHGRNSAVIVEGEAGIGKSRILQSFLEQVRQAPVRLLLSAADAIEQSTGYLVWQELLLQQLQLAQVAPAARGEHVQALLGGDAQVAPWLPLLNAVLNLGIPDTPLTREMSGTVRANNLQSLVARVLAYSATRRPLVIVIDDVHWMDSASWALLAAVWQQVSPLMLVLLTRPMGAQEPAELQALRTDARTRSIGLDRMTPDDTVLLVARRLGVEQLPEAAAAFIRERAEGHPFFAEEIGYALRDTGLLRIEHGHCAMAAGQSLEQANLPGTVQGIITSRIDRLKPPEQLTLKVASVIGRTFARPILHGVFPLAPEREQLGEHLGVLRALDLTPLESPASHELYWFKHIVTQQVAYDLMLQEQRRALHRSVAAWYEREHGQDLGKYHALLAHHWSQAEEPAKAIEYLELAAENAVAANANTEALRLLDDLEARAAALPAEDDHNDAFRRAHRQRLRATANHSLGRLEQTKVALHAALDALGLAQPKHTGGVIRSVLRELALQVSHRKFRSPTPPADARERRRLVQGSVVSEELFLVYFFDNDVPNILLTTLRAINFSEQAGEVSPGLIRGYLSLAVALEAIPLRGIVDAYLQRARDALDTQDNQAIRAWAGIVFTVIAGGRAQWPLAEEATARALAINRTLGDHRGWEECAANLELTRILYGRFDDAAEALCTQVLESGLRRQSVQVQGWGYVLVAMLAQHQQRLDDMRAPLEAFFAQVDTNPAYADEINRLEAIGLAAQVATRDGRWDDARALLVRGAAVIVALGMPSQFRIVTATQLYAEAALAFLHAHPADRLAPGWIDTALGFIGKAARSFVVVRPKLAWLRGKRAWIAGRHRAAWKQWDTSADLARTLDMPYDELLVQCARARLRADEVAAARAKALQARMRTGTPVEVAFIGA